MSHRNRPSHPVIPADSHSVPAQWNPVIPANSHFVIPANAGIHSLHVTLDPGVRRDDMLLRKRRTIHWDRPSHPVIPVDSHFVPAQWNPVIPANSHFVIPANAGIHSLHVTLDPGVRRHDCSTGGAA